MTADDARRARNWLAARPVRVFIVLAFGISYLLGVPFLVFASGAIPPHLELARLYIPRLLIVYGPALAALIMASAFGPDVRLLVRELVPTRGDLATAACIVFFGAIVSALGLLSVGVTNIDLWATLHSSAGLILAHFVLQCLCIGIGEELGWRGWLLPALAGRVSRFRATLLTGLVWTLWHGPRLIDRPTAVVFFAVSVFGLSFLFTWLWSRADHRLFPVVVAHATVNAPMFFWEQTGTLSADRLAGAWTTIQVIYTILGVTLVMRRRAWWARAARSDLTRPGASDRLR